MVDSSFEEDSSFEGPSFKWISVNEKLVANGFCAVQSTKGPPEVRQIISQLIDDYARRGQRITELMTAQKSFIPAGGAPLNACGDARVLDRHLEKIQMLQNTVRELKEKGDEAQKASAACRCEAGDSYMSVGVLCRDRVAGRWSFSEMVFSQVIT